MREGGREEWCEGEKRVGMRGERKRSGCKGGGKRVKVKEGWVKRRENR